MGSPRSNCEKNHLRDFFDPTFVEDQPRSEKFEGGAGKGAPGWLSSSLRAGQKGEGAFGLYCLKDGVKMPKKKDGLQNIL